MKKEDYFQVFADHLVYRNYSKATRDSYSCTLRCFFRYREKEGFTSCIKQSEIKAYLTYGFKQGLSWATVNNDYSALNIFWTAVLNQDWGGLKLPRPRRERPLSVIISRQAVVKLIEQASSFKYQVFLSLVNSTGLRLSEARHIRIEDVDGDRQKLHIRKGKGAKGRYVDIPPSMLVLLRRYYKAYRPFRYLFNSSVPGHPLVERTIQNVVKEAVKRARIDKQVTLHTLRHCYGTHHLESGTDILYIKKQMGHGSLKTTSRYLHLCKEYQRQVNHPIASMTIKYRIYASSVR